MAMAKRSVFAVFLFLSGLAGFVFLFSQYSYAKEADGKTKLMELREEESLLTIGHDSDLHELNKATEGKLDKIKADFRVTREACLKEKQLKERELREAYETKLKPILREKDDLIRTLGPAEGSNFAQTRPERNR